jgi:hypothetical protein
MRPARDSPGGPLRPRLGQGEALAGAASHLHPALFPSQGTQGQDQVHHHPVVLVAGPGHGVGETFHQLVLHQGFPL